jgi:hypothetical protein
MVKVSGPGEDLVPLLPEQPLLDGCLAIHRGPPVQLLPLLVTTFHLIKYIFRVKISLLDVYLPLYCTSS